MKIMRINAPEKDSKNLSIFRAGMRLQPRDKQVDGLNVVGTLIHFVVFLISISSFFNSSVRFEGRRLHR